MLLPGDKTTANCGPSSQNWWNRQVAPVCMWRIVFQATAGDGLGDRFRWLDMQHNNHLWWLEQLLQMHVSRDRDLHACQMNKLRRAAWLSEWRPHASQTEIKMFALKKCTSRVCPLFIKSTRKGPTDVMRGEGKGGWGMHLQRLVHLLHLPSSFSHSLLALHSA